MKLIISASVCAGCPTCLHFGKPVTSNNHALAWHMLRMAGVETSMEGKGELWRRPL